MVRQTSIDGVSRLHIPDRERRVLSTRRSVAPVRSTPAYGDQERRYAIYATAHSSRLSQDKPLRSTSSPVTVPQLSPPLPVTAANKATVSSPAAAHPSAREVIETADTTNSESRPRKHSLLFTGLALLVLAVTGMLSYQTWTTNTEAREVFAAPAAAASNSTDAVAAREGTDEAPVDTAQKSVYTVAPDMPRMLRIPDIGVEARILRMGVNQKGNVEAPASIWDTGWYDGSAKPGENGNAFIDGHVSGPTQPAVFQRLHTLGEGALILLERGDGSVLKYEVRSVKTLALGDVDMREVLAGSIRADQTLTVMTCGGEYLGDYTYQSRVIVTAERVA